MAVHLYNSLSRSVEPLQTIEPGIVRMYVCGVTVYDESHIGHAMSAIVFDVIRRYLEWRGYHVNHIVNFTDVDDKIINRANERGEDPLALAERYVVEFHDQIRALNVQPATLYPRATETIPEIINFVLDLINKGYAYVIDEGDVYFRVKQFAHYGKLSGRSLDDMLTGTRVEVDDRKESSADFALWKSAKPGEPAWDSPWGPGRPGWHIECSAMSMKHLGPEIDIHGGGSDLVFPHHENEIAQSEGLTGHTFARYWMHNGMLQYINTKTRQVEKMSKSLGNVVTIRSFLDTYDADVLRLIVLTSHYRKPLSYNEEIAEDNRRKLERLVKALEPGGLISKEGEAEANAELARVRDEFTAKMDDDFNTAGALAVLFDLTRQINSLRDSKTGGNAFVNGQDLLRELAGVLGLRLQAQKAAQKLGDAAPFIELLIETRNALRKARQFEQADTIRKRLTDLGVTLEDTAEGTRWSAS